jgi:drug/metabolite transporter (DMT)-like permease
VGIATGLGFAAFLSTSSLIINTKLRGKEPPNTVSFYLFLGVIVVDLPFLFGLSDLSGMFAHGFDSIETYMLLGVGVLFYGTNFLRSWALLKSNNVAVVNMLYVEIAFSFLWGTAILHQPFRWPAAAGACIIVLGCLVVSWVKSTRTPPQQRHQTVGPSSVLAGHPTTLLCTPGATDVSCKSSDIEACCKQKQQQETETSS